MPLLFFLCVLLVSKRSVRMYCYVNNATVYSFFDSLPSAIFLPEAAFNVMEMNLSGVLSGTN